MNPKRSPHPGERAQRISVSRMHLYAMVVATLRYCLGRDTYAVGECGEIVQKHWFDLDTSHRRCLERDLLAYLAEAPVGSPQLGTWRTLLNWMYQHPEKGG
jgi:hypothetical protein